MRLHMLTCEDELEDKRRHVSTSISSERPSGPQEASQVATLLHTSFEFIASFLWAPPVATQFSVVRAPTVATLVISFYVFASFLWAPPVATQFSVLS